MNENNETSIVNPCISVCKTDPLSGYCYGCGRSDEDKAMWNNSETLNNWKKSNITTLRERLIGWQLDAFDKSYKNKIETGLSLIKKKLLESKK